MAYNKNKERKDWLLRAMPIGVGALSSGKALALSELRDRVLALMREMAQAGFSPEPLTKARPGRELDARLLEVQKSCADLNSVWREQARMRVKPALEESVNRYVRRLVGGLRFVDRLIPQAERTGDRKYFNIPEDVQDDLSLQEVEALKALALTGQAVEAFRRVVIEGDTTGLSARQAAVLRFIHARAQERHRAPEFGGRDGFTLQLHLDARMLPQAERFDALALRDGVPLVLEDDGNRRYYRFLDVAGVKPRDPRIRIPLALTRKIARRMSDSRADWASLILELSEKSAQVRLVVGKPAPAPRDEEIHTLVGRDFGYANTVSLSVVESPIPIDLEAMRAELAALTDKAAAQAFIESRLLPEGVKIVERVRFSGRPFMEGIARLAQRIDGYRSRIDTQYHRLDDIRRAIAEALGLAPSDRIVPDMKRGPMGPEARAFFATLGLIRDLQQARRKLYGKIARTKRNWFGFLANVEVALAKKHRAAIVREDLTVEAIEKDSPGYKGRAFNKLINHGSKGQYQRRATDKLRWNGVPEVVIPSWYTSRSCLRHSVIVEKRHRKAERIFLPCCNRHDHADEHAADTIASYPFLQPRLTPGALMRPGFVTPAIPAPASALGSSGL